MRHFRRGQGAGDLSRHGKYLCRLRRGHPRVRREDLTPRGHGTAKIPLVPCPTAGILFDHTASRPPYPQLELYGQGGPMVPAPENIKTDHPSLLALAWSLTVFPLALKWYGLILVSILTYTLAIPRKMHTRKLTGICRSFPSFFHLDKRIYSLIHPDKKQGYELSEHST